MSRDERTLALREKADVHAMWTRRLDAPHQGPWSGYWRETAIDLQRLLDRTLDELERALRNQPKDLR